MSIHSALERFEALLKEGFPDLLAQMRPGLDDAGIARLRQALAPLHLPAQVEALYRWRDGGQPGIFGGWRLRPVEELLSWRAFCLDDLGEPPVWLQLFDDQILGFTTLGIDAAEPEDPSIWYGHTHDGWVERLVDSSEALLEVCSDALTAGALTQQRDALTLDKQAIDGPAWTPWRLARCPGAYRYPDAPPGTYISRFPEQDWPAPWLASLPASG